MNFLRCLEQHIRSESDAAIKSKCSERNCKLVLDDCRNRLILKGELIRENENESICDNLVFICKEKLIIVNVELKSKTLDYDKIVKKFRNSPKYTQRFLDLCNENEIEYIYFPLLLAKEWKTFTRRKFQDIFVSFKNKPYKLILDDCGVKISSIISKYTELLN